MDWENDLECRNQIRMSYCRILVIEVAMFLTRYYNDEISSLGLSRLLPFKSCKKTESIVAFKMKELMNSEGGNLEHACKEAAE